MTKNLSAVWRIASEEICLAEFVKEFRLKPDVILKKGDSSGSKIIKQSITSISICNADVKTLDSKLRRFFTAKKDAIAYLKRRKIKSVIDIGFMGFEPDIWAYSLNFDPELMGLFKKYDIALEVSIYRT